MPTTKEKSKQFAFIMTIDEHRMLFELAKQDGRLAAGWLRYAIRICYRDRKRRSG